MWAGPYDSLNMFGLLIQAIFIENFLLANFLGMCTYLACSTKLKTANGLGIAVVFVLTISGLLNWFVHRFVTGGGALSWLSAFGIDATHIDLSFLEFLLFISVIAGFTQILEIVIEKLSPSLYTSLGFYLPLIAVNCAILGAVLFSVTRDYPFFPNLVYVFGSALGWWLAIALMAAIREKLAVSNVVPALRGMGITFITSGLMAMAFQGFTGIKLAIPSEDIKPLVSPLVAERDVHSNKFIFRTDMGTSGILNLRTSSTYLRPTVSAVCPANTACFVGHKLEAPECPSQFEKLTYLSINGEKNGI